ncbi:MAG: cupin domain-containing protein [Novosphingobium sp.]|nr:cupin domain-containing protein [Novosphingobium sp.]MCP5403375.1 cupin domain-containing protein [Novosphingobium sp.]
MSVTPRRVIAGIGADGRSCVVRDEPIPQAGGDAMSLATLFTGPIARTSNAAPLGESFPEFSMSQLTEPVYSMMVVSYPPGLGKDDPGIHFTNTADHFYIIEGEVVLVLEAGDVVLKAGDVGICRGAMHGWRNDSDRLARLVTFVLPADPLPEQES